MDRHFTKKAVAELLGITPRTVSHYAEQGVVVPATGGEGTGRNRLYNVENLYQFLLVKELQKNGFDLKTITEIAYDSLHGMRILGPGREIVVIYDCHDEHYKVLWTRSKPDGKYVIDMTGRKSATIIDLGNLREKAEKLAK